MEEQIGQSSVQLSLLHVSNLHAKLHVRVLEGPGQNRPCPVYQVVLFLRGGLVEWVMAKGPDESFEDEDGVLDFSQPSEYEVFRRLSAELKSFVLHPNWQGAGTGPQLALRPHNNFIRRCVQYRQNFTEKCKACDKHLNNFLPPYVMVTQNSIVFYHDTCRP